MKRRAEAGLPVIAIVDAFVGALSIVLILSLLASPRQDWENSSPQAEVEMSCGHYNAQDWYWFMDAREKVFSIDELIAKLTEAAPPRHLSLRIRLTVPYDKTKCAETASRILTEENTVVRNDREPPIFILDIVRVEE